MSDLRKGTPRRRPTAKTVTSKTGNTIKLNSSLTSRIRARRDARQRRKAVYLSRLPRDPWKRLLYRLRPKELYRYWFSRQGGLMALKIIGFCIIAGSIFMVGLFAYYRKDLPNIKDISGDNLGGSITYYDRTGKVVLWQDYSAVKRIPIPGNQQSNYMRDATVATEDKNFYNEGAFNVKSIARAAYDDFLHHSSGSGLQGGSTITQQLVKLNENWIGVETIGRKIKEIILAVEVGREYSKSDILTAYLNIAPYGGVENGVEAAANDYFHEDASQLTLAQAAFLATMPKAPSLYSPYSDYFDKTAFLARYDYILQQMVSQHMITQAQATDAENTDVLSQIQPLESKYQGIQAPYFVLAAKQQLESKYGESTVKRGGWKIITTLDVNLQHDAETAVANNLPNVERYRGDEEATVLENVPTGQIEALVGGVDFNNPTYGQLNFAASVQVSPGSSFKPYDYTSLINDSTNAGAGSVLYDSKGPLSGYSGTCPYDPYTPGSPPCPGGTQPFLYDYDNRFPGPETLRYAIGGSRNVPAVKAMLTIGTGKVIQTADAMMAAPHAYNCYSDTTLTQTSPCYGASAIGDGAYLTLINHVNGDSTLGRLGQAIPETFILKITDSSNKTVYQWTQPAPTQVVRTDAAYIVDNMLSDPRSTYLPGSCSTYTCTQLNRGGYKWERYNGWDVAVKTGTTNNDFDGLMTGWTTQWADVSWVGYHTRNVAMTGGAMEYMTEPLTRTMVQEATDYLHESPVNWTQPSDIKTLPAYVISNHIGIGSEEPSPSTDIYPSWYVPPKNAGGNETIDLVSNMLATSCTPPLAKKSQGNNSANIYSIDIFYGNSNAASAAGGADNVHNCNDSLPAITVTEVSCDDTGKCDFTVTVTQGTHVLSGGSYTSSPAGSISLLDNNNNIQTVSIPQNASSPYTTTISVNNVKSGDSITAQVVDSVLYSTTSSATTATTTTTNNTTQNNNNGNDGNNGGTGH
ncbi:MAG TPA: transglycosylase domain-containing protein [Candidatus Saccharimonadales bacterium]|nr:transglycosylase domain-containing protein [Candidatus Saccharimonadales bacterium]